MKYDAFGNEISGKSWWPSRRVTGEDAEESVVSPTEPAEPAVPLWRRLWSWGRWALLVIVVVNIVAGLLGDGDGVNAIEVGDCFNLENVEVIDGFKKIECSEDHEYELYSRIEITGFGEDYPGADTLFASMAESCLSGFAAYVGTEFESSVYWVFTIIPDDTSWESGDRTGLCSVYLGDSDGNLLISDRTARAVGV